LRLLLRLHLHFQSLLRCEESDQPSLNCAHPIDPPSLNCAHPIDPPSLNCAHHIDQPSLNCAHPIDPPDFIKLCLHLLLDSLQANSKSSRFRLASFFSPFFSHSELRSMQQHFVECHVVPISRCSLIFALHCLARSRSRSRQHKVLDALGHRDPLAALSFSLSIASRARARANIRFSTLLAIVTLLQRSIGHVSTTLVSPSLGRDLRSCCIAWRTSPA
jgi:hypothetical protein